MRVSGVTLPASISAAAVSTFSTDPGSYTSNSDRMPRSASGESIGWLASKVGWSASARTSPVLLSSTTAAPDSPRESWTA